MAKICCSSVQLAEMGSQSSADQNSKQTFSRQIDMPESAFMNPFQLFPITLLLYFGLYLCPEVCSSRPYMEGQETEHSEKNYVSNTEFYLGC